MNDLTNSAIATLIAEVVTLPTCTLKTCYQNAENIGIKTLARQIYHDHGIRGFYRASLPAIGGQVVSSSSKYYFYRFYERNLFESQTNLRQKMCAGWLSGVTSTIITHPLDFFKVKMQASLNRETHATIRQELKKNGHMVLYRGYTKTLAKVSVGSVLFFPLTDFIREKTDNIVLASASSAIISTIIMHPLDYLKTIHLNGKLKYSRNPLDYYRGLSLNLLRIVPHFTITMTVISLLTS